MTAGLFDTHAHYYDNRFSEEGVDVDALLKDIFESGVEYIINAGTNNDNSLLAIEQAKKYGGMYAAAGIHPSDCYYLDDIGAEIKKLRALLDNAKENKIVAIGEIGFDYHWEETDKVKQREYFSLQMEEAKKRGLPVIIHDRDAHGDCFDMIRAHPGVSGVMHSFSGSAESARELVKRGWYISFSGTITFKNAARVREAAASVPPDRILIETDCPYLAPHPHRGEINHSGYIRYTAEAVANVLGVTFEEAVKLTSENAKRLFGI